MKRAILLLALLAVGSMFGCSDDKEPTIKNRVPTLADYAGQAEQSAKDAKAAADSVAQTKKDIDAAIEKLNGVQRTSDGELKEGRPEMTAPGSISEVGSYKVEADSGNTASDDFYLGFTFTDRNGLTKRFFPVCPNTTVKTGSSIAILYHWQHYQSASAGQRGCYKIDGQQAQ